MYLQATSAKFPAFQKIIVASPTTIVWGDTLQEALDSLLREQGRVARSVALAGSDADAGSERDARPDGDARHAADAARR